jgi:hypothetical protein
VADYAADNVSSSSGVQLNQRTGSASADTVPAGSYVVWRNTGAGSHIVTLTIAATHDGQGVTPKPITIPAGAAWGGRIPQSYGDANGRVPVAINGTATEVVYYVLGGM